MIRAQVFNSSGQAVGAPVTFTKPNGTLEGTPVIKQLANGGFAIAFMVDVGEDDENIYTASATSNVTVITQTMYVGTSTAGDQWDPSLIALTGNNYAVSWQSGPEYIIEVIGVDGVDVTTPTVPNPNTDPDPDPNPDPYPDPDPDFYVLWNGTNGNGSRPSFGR